MNYALLKFQDVNRVNVFAIKLFVAYLLKFKAVKSKAYFLTDFLI